MSFYSWLQIWLYFAALIGCAVPLGWYMARVLEGQAPNWLAWLTPIERLIYRVCGIDPHVKMDWKRYAVAVLLFNLTGALAVYGVARLQDVLPLNPQHMAAVKPDTSFNTAMSFATNTNWQDYGGEMTMSYFTQMIALSVQNFVSAATGIACLLALIRGFRREGTDKLGNFWEDLTRTVLYVLMPLSVVLALALVSPGVIQNLTPYQTVPLVQPVTYDTPVLDTAGNPVINADGTTQMTSTKATEQTLAMGPAASQVAIKQLGTNGGGFFNVNSAHPFENPTPLSNFLEMLAILLIPAALCITFGEMIGDRRQGWAILAAMTLLLAGFMALCIWSEQGGNPGLAKLPVNQSAYQAPPSGTQFKRVDLAAAPVSQQEQCGGNMEGKELRFGIVNSGIWATATTAASNGSVNSMHDSYTPLGGLAPMLLMQLGEVVFGGVGSGLYGMLIFAICAVFVAGLMVGRTPEYLGKKIEAFEMKMAAVIILIPPLVVLACTAVAVMTDAGMATRSNPGAHGFSQLLYAYSSMGNNNGSAFGGMTSDIPLHNIMGGIAMLVSRFWLVVPTLAIAGTLAKKKTVPPSAGTLPTHTPLFVALLIGVVLIVGALTFVPALVLGPIAEHLQMAG